MTFVADQERYLTSLQTKMSNIWIDIDGLCNNCTCEDDCSYVADWWGVQDAIYEPGRGLLLETTKGKYTNTLSIMQLLKFLRELTSEERSAPVVIIREESHQYCLSINRITEYWDDGDAAWSICESREPGMTGEQMLEAIKRGTRQQLAELFGNTTIEELATMLSDG
jgi:hypothetical protein